MQSEPKQKWHVFCWVPLCVSYCPFIELNGVSEAQLTLQIARRGHGTEPVDLSDWPDSSAISNVMARNKSGGLAGKSRSFKRLSIQWCRKQKALSNVLLGVTPLRSQGTVSKYPNVKGASHRRGRAASDVHQIKQNNWVAHLRKTMTTIRTAGWLTENAILFQPHGLKTKTYIYSWGSFSMGALLLRWHKKNQQRCPIHTGPQHANLWAIPLMLLVSSVHENSPSQCSWSRFHLLALALSRPVWIGS